jgi:hypothetical protein
MATEAQHLSTLHRKLDASERAAASCTFVRTRGEGTFGCSDHAAGEIGVGIGELVTELGAKAFQEGAAGFACINVGAGEAHLWVATNLVRKHELGFAHNGVLGCAGKSVGVHLAKASIDNLNKGGARGGLEAGGEAREGSRVKELLELGEGVLALGVQVGKGPGTCELGGKLDKACVGAN